MNLVFANRGVLYALGAAALFGASTPFAKLLLGDVSPLVLAAILYLGWNLSSDANGRISVFRGIVVGGKRA